MLNARFYPSGNPYESNEEVSFVTPVSSFSVKKTSAKDNLLIFQDLKTINRLADKLFVKGSFDVIHVADPYLGPYLNSSNIVTTVHDTSVGELRFMLGNIRTVTDMKYSIFFAFLGPWLEQLTLRKSKSIIAVNEHIKHELCTSYGISSRRIDVITNGVEIPNTILKDTAKEKLSLPLE